jgi:hypothetical protein
VALRRGVVRTMDPGLVTVPPLVTQRHPCADPDGVARRDDRCGPYGRTKRAERIVAVDVTGLSVAALVVPAYTHESRASEHMLEQLDQQGITERLEPVGVSRSSFVLRPDSGQIRTLPIALHTGADRADGGRSMSLCDVRQRRLPLAPSQAGPRSAGAWSRRNTGK